MIERGVIYSNKFLTAVPLVLEKAATDAVFACSGKIVSSPAVSTADSYK